MARENVELARSVFAAWARGDYESADWADPRIEAVVADGPSPGAWSGLAGMAEGWGEFLGAWDNFRHERADEYRELDDDRVLVLVQWGGRGKASGLALEQMHSKGAVLLQMQRGKVTKVVAYLSRERAFADFGLSE
jgi:ketosteroid isomerase-like protein